MQNLEMSFLIEEREKTVFELKQRVKDLPKTVYQIADVEAWAKQYPLGTTAVAFFCGLESGLGLQRCPKKTSPQRNSASTRAPFLASLITPIRLILRQSISTLIKNFLYSKDKL